MKKILFLFSFLPLLAQAQSSAHLPVTHFDSPVEITKADTSIFWDTIPYHWATGKIATSLPYSGFRVPDCEPWETFTEWEAKNTGKGKCAHDWVVAEWNDVNVIDPFTTLEMPPPCGKTRHENEARICRTCLRHETRVRTYGMKEVVKKSEFQTLLEKIHDR